MPKLNMDGVQPWGGPRLGVGFHPLIVDDVEDTHSKAGNPMFVLTLRATAGPEAGATITDRLVFVDTAMGRVLSFMQAAGIEVPEGDFDLTADEVKGRKVMGMVREGEPFTGDDGKLRTKNEVVAYEEYDWQNDSDVPADTNGLATASANVSDDDIPF
jgi:hypothetical protein